MKDKIEAYAQSSGTCQCLKTMYQQKFGKPPLRNVNDEKPWEHISVNLVGPWTEKIKHTKTQKVTKQTLWALTAIDKATVWPEIVWIKEKSSLNISNFFDQAWLCQYPRPTEIMFDNKGEFLGKEFQELIKSRGITASNITVEKPVGQREAHIYTSDNGRLPSNVQNNQLKRCR